MAKVRFSTAKGSETMGASPFYIGVVQHDRTMCKK